jgi:hypothetical protein
MVNTGGKGATPVLVPQRKQPEPKKITDHQVLCQKMNLTNSSYI